jgi:hypothetical protein
MNFRSIALGGGGTRGGLHIGALAALREKLGHLEFPDGIYGGSVGAILATAVAFRIDLERLNVVYAKYFSLEHFVPPPTVDHLLTGLDRKGLFSMDHLERMLHQVFRECGVDLWGKRIRDAPQPLFVVASNMTTGRPTILTGDVPLLKALLCSSCIPVLFEPQVLYNNVYLDAGVHLRCLASVVPPTTPVIHVSGAGSTITSESSLQDILFAAYSGSAPQYLADNVCRIQGIEFGLLGELSQADRDYLFREGYSQTLRWLTKMGL